MKNRYLVFAGIGFEMIALILAAIYLGQYLVEKKIVGDWIKAILIVVAFVVWFISLVVKLKAGEKKTTAPSETTTDKK